MNKALEETLSDMYTEIIIFCTRAITFLRNNPNIESILMFGLGSMTFFFEDDRELTLLLPPR